MCVCVCVCERERERERERENCVSSDMEEMEQQRIKPQTVILHKRYICMSAREVVCTHELLAHTHTHTHTHIHTHTQTHTTFHGPSVLVYSLSMNNVVNSHPQIGRLATVAAQLSLENAGNKVYTLLNTCHFIHH